MRTARRGYVRCADFYDKTKMSIEIDAHSHLPVYNQIALVTLPERKQRVQAYTRFGVPLTSAFTRLIFGFQVLLVRL